MPSESSVLEAIAHFETALRLDPAFATARARLAHAYAQSLNWAFRPGGLSSDSVLALGFGAAGGALERDSTIADAWLARGFLLSLGGRPEDLEPAIRAVRHGLMLDPSQGHGVLGSLLRRAGRFDESEQETLRALALDAGNVGVMADLAYLALSRRSHQAARWWHHRLNAVDSTVSHVATFEARARAAAGDTAGSLSAARRALAHSTDAERLRALATLAETEVRAGDRVSASRHFSEALQGLGGSERTLPPILGVRNAWECASAAVALGQRDLALTILERVRPRGPWLWSYLILESFDPIRADPRFRRIIDEARPPGARDPV